MSSTREEIPPPPRRKRQYTETGLSLDNPSESQPSKRLKSSRAEFYDSLSKVWLTRRALKELDRRTLQANIPQRLTPPSQRVYPEETSKQKRFARHGGPDLRDLRGYPAPIDIEPTRAMASSSSSRSKHTKSTALTSTSSKTKRSSAYDKDFEQHYVDHRVYPEGYDYGDRCPTPEPRFDGLDQRLLQPRPSLSPSHFPDSAFRDYKRKNARVISEGKVMNTVFPIISGDADIPNEGNLQFTRLESMTGCVTVDPRPDFYDGARFEDIDREVREELGPYIIPTGHLAAPVAPNFFMEAKAPSGGADVAKRQAMQDGAYGARAMHSLQSYSEGKPVYDGNAYTITSTYHTGLLRLYATHPTAGPENSPEYHMTQINGWDLTNNPDTFRQGVTAFRNARDWAQEQRDALINAANRKARSTNPEPTRTEHMPYSDWLAALDTGDVSTHTVEDGLSQPQVLYEEQSTFESSHDDRFSNEPSDSPDGLTLDASFAIPTTEIKHKHKSKDALKSRSKDSASSNRERRRSKRGKVDVSSSSVSD
ncbi:hypothetical protein DL98DRAFT_522428 [Cadophora sp. DSE1049]|nr:hypothetical protein DL98DRAFT_522428 [Cadophora sp. DSE1049]